MTFIIARIPEESAHHYHHNFVSIIEEKVHPLLSPKNYRYKIRLQIHVLQNYREK